MSFAWLGWELPSGTLGNLEVFRCGCVGHSSPSLRLRDSFSFPSISFQGSASTPELFPLLHPGDCSGGSGCRLSGERGYRTSPFLSWLLQSAVRNTQGHWRLAASDRSLSPKLFCGRLPLPHRDVSVVPPISSSRGLAGILGPPGCVPSGSGASFFSSVSEVLCGRGVFQFRSLCFGLSTAPQVFTRFMAPVSSIMHRYGFRILR